MPTPHERARQTLVRQALEPEWDAKLSAHFSGFRPGRSCWEAIAAVFHRSKFRPQYLLKVDISKCFDRIDPAAFLAKLHAPSGIRRQVRAWVRSGIREADTFTPTTAGTPQGGAAAPLFALIALHGMDEAITQISPEARGIAYADDCLVLPPDRAVLDHCQPLFMAWLAGMGLTLHVTKTRIGHTLEGDQPGMDCLGFHLRQYRVGKHQSGKRSNGERLGCKTLITPAKANRKDHLAELGRLIRAGQNWPQAALLHTLTPKIRGCAPYSRTWVCHTTFGRLDRLTWVQRRSWARRRHPRKSTRGVYNRYWPRRDSRRVFATPATRPSQAYLASHGDTASLRHAKVTGHRSPYDGDWVYWSKRQGRYPTVSPRLATLLKRQGGRCTHCGLFFHHADQLEIDHIHGDRRDSRYANLHALHGHGHDAKTRNQGEHLPVGIRDKHQDTEERCERKLSCPVLVQR